MALRKRSVILDNANPSKIIGLGSAGATISRVDYLSSVDTTVSCEITDVTGKNLDGIASGNWTTRVTNHVADFMAVSPITVTATALGSGIFTVDVWCEV